MKTPPKARTAPRRNRSVPCGAPGYDGQITYELEEFRKDHGSPEGRLFTFELTYNGTTYVYANVAGEVRSGEVVFDLSGDNLVGTRKSH